MSESNWKQAGVPSPGDNRDADQVRIDAALVRRYRAPAGLGQRLRGELTGLGLQPVAPAVAAGEGSSVPASSSTAAASGSAGIRSGLRLLRGPALCLAAAAALLLILAPRLGRGAGENGDNVAGGGGDYPLRGGVECDDPETQFGGAPLAFDSPDLASLYHEVVSMAGSHETRASECVHPGDGDSLLASLRQDYGTSLRQVGDAARLAGPFPAADWRSGTVLTGYPEEGGWPSVLVAESASNLSCCVVPIQPSDPELHVFTATVGDMALFEITRRGEPRFLDRFEQP